MRLLFGCDTANVSYAPSGRGVRRSIRFPGGNSSTDFLHPGSPYDDLSMTELRAAALLFDLDGVLINSTPAVARVWRRWAIEHGFDPVEVVARAHGRPSLTTVCEYLPKADHAA